MSTLADEIITLIKSQSNNTPPPMRCNISKVYEDQNHVDVQTKNGELRYVDAIGSNIKLGDNAVILFFDEDYEDYVVIADTDMTLEDYYTKEQIDKIIEEIISGQIDLKEYMKKEDYTNDLGNLTDSGEFLQALDNTIQAITGRGDDF